jgi:hypothetical protein
MSRPMPVRRAHFQCADFAAWLSMNGAEVAAPTNPYEVVRYRAFWCGSKRAVTHVVYTKDSGLLTFTSGSQEHYRAFLDGQPLEGQAPRAMAPVNPRPDKDPDAESKGDKVRRRLLARDGDECWFCGLAMGSDVTVEHLVPKSKGGSNRLDNYALAHRACNHLAADKPLVAKIELRAQLRKEIA